jgi:hypothetical protein
VHADAVARASPGHREQRDRRAIPADGREPARLRDLHARSTGHVETWNAGAQRFKGYAAYEIIGKHFSVFYPDTDVAAGKCERELEIATRVGRFEDEGWRVRKDGSQFWANIVITAIRDGAGQLVGFAKVTRDLTERKLAEELRRVQEEPFGLLVSSVKDYALLILDRDSIVTTWNAGAERIKGYRADEVIGSHFSRFYPEEDVLAGRCERELEAVARDGRFEDEGWRVRKDGTKFWANVVITALCDSTGELFGYGKVTRDLIERKAAEEQRRSVEASRGLMIASVRDYALLTLDASGRVVMWNAGAEKIKGYRAHEIVGKHFSVFYPEDDVLAGKCERELVAAAAHGSFEDEGWRVRKDGSRFWANVVISAIRDDLGELVGYSKVTRDLTERRRAEEEALALRVSEQANRSKDAMLGHELRNPLAPIASALQLLELRGDPRSVREHQIIDRHVKQMTRLVDDLLDVSRVNRGKIELKSARIDLRDALLKAVEIAIPLFERKNHRFEVDIPSSPAFVNGDDARLPQVFANLLTNAGKYTQDGGAITLRVRHAAHHVVVEVLDNGAGIDAQLLPRLFDLCVQGYQDVDRAEGGLGIGLTLVKSLVELHCGEVEARSAGRGRGSRFVVRLPVALSAADDDGEAPAGAPAPYASRRCEVLLVDDTTTRGRCWPRCCARSGTS